MFQIFKEPVNPFDPHDGNPAFHHDETLFDSEDSKPTYVDELTQYGDIHVVPEAVVLGSHRRRRQAGQAQMDDADRWLMQNDPTYRKSSR